MEYSDVISWGFTVYKNTFILIKTSMFSISIFIYKFTNNLFKNMGIYRKTYLKWLQTFRGGLREKKYELDNM